MTLLPLPLRAASIHSRLWAWQAVSTTDSSPKHLFPQAFSIQKGLRTLNRELITVPEIVLIIQDCSFHKFQSNQNNKTPYLNRILWNRELLNHERLCIYAKCDQVNTKSIFRVTGKFSRCCVIEAGCDT